MNLDTSKTGFIPAVFIGLIQGEAPNPFDTVVVALSNRRLCPVVAMKEEIIESPAEVFKVNAPILGNLKKDPVLFSEKALNHIKSNGLGSHDSLIEMRSDIFKSCPSILDSAKKAFGMFPEFFSEPQNIRSIQ